VARDRQRAKQRKARRAGQNPGPARSEPHRADVPGELEHASGEADEFDAALVAGAGGRTADSADTEDTEDAAGADDELIAAEDLDGEPAGEIYEDELPEDDEFADEHEDPEDEALAREAVAAAPAARRRGRAAAEAHRAEAPAPRGPARFLAFLRASWAELQRVQWPDRRQVAQATAVVLGFVVVAGLYLGVADRVAQEVVDFII
jgi:preprotein translocase subunit SecE